MLATKTQLPRKWDSFLRVDENKTELFHYIANCMKIYLFSASSTKQIVTTYDDAVITSSAAISTNNLSPCNHEEDDYRALLHGFHMSQSGLQKVMISTTDTDVVAIAVSCFDSMMLEELWIKFGVGEKMRYLPIHEIVCSIGPQTSQCMAIFHSFTGCDQVSFFSTIGKKTAWKTWRTYPPITNALLNIRNMPSEAGVEYHMPTIERFVCLMYHPTSTKMEVNECRRNLFTKQGRQLEGLPLTKEALKQHTRRAVYQGAYVWSQALTALQNLPNPEVWGWVRENNTLSPMWSVLPSVAEACRELTKCSCKIEKGCSGRCSCKRSHLPCTELCKCNGDCE